MCLAKEGNFVKNLNRTATNASNRHFAERFELPWVWLTNRVTRVFQMFRQPQCKYPKSPAEGAFV